MVCILVSQSGCVAKIDSESTSETIVSTTEYLALLEAGEIPRPTLDQLKVDDPDYNHEMASEIAHEISQEINDLGLPPLEAKYLQDYGNFTTEAKRMNQVIKILNEKMELEFLPIPIDEITHNQFLTIINKGEKYVPVISSYNDFLKSSNNVLIERDNELFVKQFYIAAFLLGVDVCFIQSGISYRLAFKSTRIINNELKLAKATPYLGNSGYK